MRDGAIFETQISPLKIPEQERYLFGFNVQQISGDLSNVINTVAPDTPAETSGLKPEDKVIKLNNIPVSNKRYR